MASGRERAFLTRLLRESVLTLCRETIVSYRHLSIDGIVCISLDDDKVNDVDHHDSDNNDKSPIVVRIHERLQKGQGCGSSLPLGSSFEDEKRRSLLEQSSSHALKNVMKFESRHNDIFAPRSSPDSSSSQMPLHKLRREATQSSDVAVKFPRLELACPQLEPYFDEPRSRLQDDLSPTDSTEKDGGAPTLKRASTDSAVSFGSSSASDIQAAGSPRSDGEFETQEPSERPREPAQVSYSHMAAKSGYVSHKTSGSRMSRGAERSRAVFQDMAARRGLPCRRCDTVLPDILALERHNLQAHAIFTCSICTTTFTARNNLKRHVRMHSGVKPFKCGTCGAAFSRKDDLRTHELRHTCGRPKRRQQYRCHLCSFVGEGPLVFQKHLLKHTTIEEYTCPPCGFSSSDPFAYTSHLKGHSSNPLFEHYLCCFCRRRLPTYELFMKHEMSHTQQNPAHDCPVCNKRFRTYANLREHFLTHNLEQNVKSDERTTTPNQDMDGGQRSSPARPEAHQSCHQGYKDEQEEEEAEADSGPPMPYWCTECTKGFQDEASFRLHIRNLHEAVGTSQADKDANQQQDDDIDDDKTEDEEEMETSKPCTSPEVSVDVDDSETALDARKDGGRAAESPENSQDEDTVDTDEARTERESASRNGDLLKSRSMRQESLGRADPETRHPDARSPAVSSPASAASTQTIGKSPTIPLIKVPLPISAEGDLPKDHPLSPSPSSLSQSPENNGSGVSMSWSAPSMRLVKPKDLIFSSDDPYARASAPSGPLSSKLASNPFRHYLYNNHNLYLMHTSPVVDSRPPVKERQEGFVLDLHVKEEPASDHEESGSPGRSSAARDTDFPLRRRPMDRPSPDLPCDLSMPRPHSASPRSSGSSSSSSSSPSSQSPQQMDSGRSLGFEKVVTPQVLFRAQKGFSCKICDRHFLDFPDLEAHSAAEHRRFLCEYCGKSFTAKPNRDRHVRYHTGERPYRCTLCPQAFFRGDDLKYHRTTKHANVPVSLATSHPPSSAPSLILNGGLMPRGADMSQWRKWRKPEGLDSPIVAANS